MTLGDFAISYVVTWVLGSGFGLGFGFGFGFGCWRRGGITTTSYSSPSESEVIRRLRSWLGLGLGLG